MEFCRYCGKEIAETAQACPQCGGIQQRLATNANDGPVWMSVASVILGTLSLFAFFDPSPWDEDTFLGIGMFSLIGLILGSISLGKAGERKKAAIAGVVLSSLALLALIGKLPA